MGSPELWEIATKTLKTALEQLNCSFIVQEGEGAFYGPKIEIKIEDRMGREWQCGTLQVDFNMPERFDLTFVQADQQRGRPVMLHRAIYGSIERFLGILIEHYKGHFPFWLAPVQATVLTITDEQKTYAHEIARTLEKRAKIRVKVNNSSDPISGQIKDAQLMGIPWMLVVGKKEVAQNTVTIRYLDGKQEFGITIDDLVQRALQANEF